MFGEADQRSREALGHSRGKPTPGRMRADPEAPPPGRLLCFATQGADHGEAKRIASLLAPLKPQPWPFDRAHKWRSFLRLIKHIRKERPPAIVMEGTGIAGGMAVLVARLWWKAPYIVSSGDAVAPFVRSLHPSLALPAALYERLLYRLCAGFIGWTPYLVGRALTFGAPRAMTAANWAPTGVGAAAPVPVRQQLSIPKDALVFGLVGTLQWNRRVGYCYGLELVEAVRQTARNDVFVLIVGDGSGRSHLAALAGDRLGSSVLLPGRVARPEIPHYLAAMDVASLPQSLDGVGAFRYTTKLSEYLTAGLPVVTGRLPFSYDVGDDGWLWRLPGDAPWDEVYTGALASLMDSLSREELEAKRVAVPRRLGMFDYERQKAAVTAFVSDILAPSARGE